MHVVHPMILASTLNPEHLLETFGTIGLIVIIFLESCFAPLPGDSLLFSAGLLASNGRLNLAAILLGTGIAAIAGNQVGYWFGRKAGTTLYKRPDSRFFKQEHIEKTHAYFERFGPKTILLARLIPIVRGFAPIVAGVGRMNYRTFTIYNVVGGVLWVVAFSVGGWALGKQIHDVDKYVLPLVALVVVVTSIPVVVEYYRAKKHLSTPTPSGEANRTIEDEIAPQ